MHEPLTRSAAHPDAVYLKKKREEERKAGKLKARNETQQGEKKRRKEHKEKSGNKVASGVSITSEISDFLTHCSWKKIEQLYSAARAGL